MPYRNTTMYPTADAMLLFQTYRVIFSNTVTLQIVSYNVHILVLDMHYLSYMIHKMEKVTCSGHFFIVYNLVRIEDSEKIQQMLEHNNRIEEQIERCNNIIRFATINNFLDIVNDKQ